MTEDLPEKMRVAIDLTALAYNFTGIERYAFEVTKSLLEINAAEDAPLEYILVFKEEIHPPFDLFIQEGKALAYVIKSNKGKLWVTQFELPRALNKINADRNLFLSFPAPILYRSQNNISVIHDLTCWDFPETISFKNRLFWRTAISRAISSEGPIVTVSEFSKHRIIDRFQVEPEQVIVAYCASSDIFKEQMITLQQRREMQDKYSLPEEFVLTVGTLEPRKNIPLLIQAWADLFEEKQITADLVLSGREGWMTNNLLSGLSEQQRAHVHITGFVEDEDLPLLYAMSSLFVFPSLYEGFGMPPVEAVNSGAAVLCSDIECLQEICKDEVSYFKSNDLSDLKQAMLRGARRGGSLSYNFRDSALRIRKLLR